MKVTLQKKIVLHIDDDLDDRHLVKEIILELDRDITYHEVNDGCKALSFLEEAATNDRLPSLIILDMNMPIMDGKMFLKELKSNKKLSSIKTAIFTTSWSPSDETFAKNYSIELIRKPPTISQLSDIIEKLLSWMQSDLP